MKWFVIVVMTTQLNSGGELETPLFIPYLEFDSKEQCVSYVQDNQDMLFYKSYEKYEKTISPKMINCVDKDIMKRLSNIIEGKGNETDI